MRQRVQVPCRAYSGSSASLVMEGDPGFKEQGRPESRGLIKAS